MILYHKSVDVLLVKGKYWIIVLDRKLICSLNQGNEKVAKSYDKVN
jgi:hypothetical protein